MTDTKTADPWAGVNLSKEVPADPWKGIQLFETPKLTASSIYDAIRNTVVGQNEFDYPEINSSGASLIDTDLLKARDGRAMVDIIKQKYPGAAFGKDKFGNQFVTLPGEGEKPHYLNKSGLSNRDVDEFGRDLLLTMPLAGVAGAVTRGAAMPLRAAAQAIAGAVGSLGSDVVSGVAGSKQGVDIPAVIASALGGAFAEGSGSSINWLLSAVRNNPSRWVQNGQLTPQAAEFFAQAGFNPNEISATVAQEFARRARMTGGSTATAREVAAGEFGIPLTRGQATADPDRIAFEEAARHGARGEMAADIVRGRMNRQREAIETAQQNIGDELAPNVGTRNVQESAGTVLEGVRNRAEEMGRSVNAFYDAARPLMREAAVDRGAVTELPNIVRSRLNENDFVIVPSLHPSASAALDLLDNLAAGRVQNKAFGANIPQQAPDDMVGIALNGIESIRRQIGGANGLLASAQNPADRNATRQIVRAFDEWLGDVADGQLIAGNPQAVEAIRRARDAASRNFALFGERNIRGGDDAGRVVERMIAQDLTEQEVANFLFGSNKIGDSGRAYRVAKRVEEIVGRDSDEWDAVRRGMWQRITQGPEGGTQPGAQAVSSSILEFVNGKGQTLASTLYTPDELSMMRRYAAALRTTVPPPEATNPSKSGYEAARALGDLFSAPSTGWYIRMFGQARNAASAVRALPGGAPVERLPAPAGLPALGSVGGERVLTD